MRSNGWNQARYGQPRSSRASLLRAFLATCLLVLSVAGSEARAETALLSAAKDSTLHEDPSGALANGSGPVFFAGRINTAAQSLRRALISFDIAAALPSGSTIIGARLSLNLSSTSAGAVTVRLHRLLADWGEGASVATGGGGAQSLPGDSTWLHRFYDQVFWASPGGDLDPIPRAEALVDQPAIYAWGPTFDMTADVQSWLDHPESAFGWILIGDESRPQTVKRFDSRENAAEANRPVLEIEYLPPCAPSPVGAGFWRSQCGSSAIRESVLACTERSLAVLGLSGIDPCEAIVFGAPRSCEERAIGKLAVLVLNVCAGRLQTSCPVTPEEADCASESVGDLLREVADLILAGDCRLASGCAGALD